MFAKRLGFKLLGSVLLTAGVIACQAQQQQQPQQTGSTQTPTLNAGGFEGIEGGRLALLAAKCDLTTDPIVVTVASGEFAYLYLRTDNYVVVNADAQTGGQCAFVSTKTISIVAKESSGSTNHKVLVDFMSGLFPTGSLPGVGITIDFKTTGLNEVMFRGTTDPDVFSLGTKAGTSYLAFATASTTPVTPPANAIVSMLNVSDVMVSAGPGDDIIDGQGTSITTPSGMAALTGSINLTVFGGTGNDQITSGAAGSGRNDLNGNAGSDVFYQLNGVYAHDTISGGTDPNATLTTTSVTTNTATVTDTMTAATTATLTNSQTASTTKSVTATGTVTAVYTGTKTGTVTGSGTVSATQTATGTTSWSGTYTGTGTNVGVIQSFTGTVTATKTVSATFTVTATGSNTASASKTATASAIGSDTKTNTQTYTVPATSISSTSVQTDTSIDVVDYSARTTPVTVTLGDEGVSAAVSASATIVVPNSDAIRNYDSFSIDDGDLSSPVTKVVEFQRAGSYAIGDLTVPANGAADLANDDQFTIDDGTGHAVTFHLVKDSGTSSGTDSNANISISTGQDQATVGAAIVAGIKNYQTATWTGTSTGTATMTSTSLIPNVTVTPPSAGVISVQDRVAGNAGSLLAETGGLSVSNGTPTTLWNNGDPTGNSSIVVSFDDASGSIPAATMATSVGTAISGGGLNVTTATSGTIVTVTAAGAHAVKSAFLVSLNSGGCDITMVSLGTPATGPGNNDGYTGEADSVGADIETVIGGSSDDVIDATYATNIAHTLFGMSGNDTLIIGSASTASNFLYGGKGNDHLLGGSGVDTLYGGDGDDYLAGGPGSDHIYGDGVNCVVGSAGSLCDSSYAASSGTGSNYLDYSDRTAPVVVNLKTMANDLQVGVNGEKDDVHQCTNLRGGSGADTLTGDDGANIIYGGPGDDTINGGAGADTIYGDGGDDIIRGGAGNDYIYGGTGLNHLYGDDPTDPSIVFVNMLDNSQGRLGVLDCGLGDMDVLFSDGEETSGADTCEFK